MPRNVASSKQLELHGVTELQSNINEAIEAMGGKRTLSRGQKSAITQRAFKIMGDSLREAAAIVKRRTIENARQQGWPSSAIAGVFAYYDPSKEKRRTSALAGISKKASMVEWYPGNSTSSNAKVLPGTTSAKGASYGLQQISMSLATMFEYGTSKLRKRPALRPAIASMRAIILARLVVGYTEVIRSLNYGDSSSSSVPTSKAA